MRAALRPYHRRSGGRPDWALVVVGLMAAALLAGTAIRTEGTGQPSQFGLHVGGLLTLSEGQVLVVFEDMTAPPPSAVIAAGAGWSGGGRNAEHLGLGAIWLADPGADSLVRNIPLPQDTGRAMVTFDLIAIDDWALQGLAVAINGAEVLRHRFTTRPDLPRPTGPDAIAPGDVAVRATLGDPREMGFASGGPALREERLSVALSVPSPGPALTLAITQLPATRGDAALGPPHRWAIDNLIVIADRAP